VTTPGLRLGAPGVYRSPQRIEPRFQPVRLDVCGFVGVALRGPANSAVLVQSWSDYQRIFGGYERPGNGPDRMLPYAVAAFFAQGATRAYVLRVAPADSDPDATAAAACACYQVGPVQLAAANEGSWGNGLDITVAYEAAQSFAGQPDPGAEAALLLPPGLTLPVGTLLRLRAGGLAAVGEFRWVTGSGRDASGQPLVTVDPPLGAITTPTVDADVVTAVLSVTDQDPDFARSDRIDGLGLDPRHPRFIGAIIGDLISELAGTETALVEATLVRFAQPLTGRLVPDSPLLAPLSGSLISRGIDRWDQIDSRSFFDDDPSDADPLDELPHRGADLMAREDEIGLLCVPDLFWAWPAAVPAPEPDPDKPSACFQRCPASTGPTGQISYAASPVVSARLDPRDPAQLPTILALQARLVILADLYLRFVALLDVPPGLALGDIVRWRANFDSSYAAAYHPWLGVPRVEPPSLVAGQDEDAATAQVPSGPPASAVQVPAQALAPAVQVPPSAFAAGIVAAREQRLGLAWGPANELALTAVTATDTITDSEHDQLHLIGINVYRQERDGFRLTAARTLSSDPDYRQLSVRRLMTMIALTLNRQTQWLVFEPNDTELRTNLTHTITAFLRRLFRARALAGSTEAESFFVQCDDRLNPPESQALGRLIALVGVAPARPLEYLVLRITQDTDGTINVEAGSGQATG
jgi:hypothetical protein